MQLEVEPCAAFERADVCRQGVFGGRGVRAEVLFENETQVGIRERVACVREGAQHGEYAHEAFACVGAAKLVGQKVCEFGGSLLRDGHGASFFDGWGLFAVRSSRVLRA